MLPSTIGSSTPVTVTVCATFQFAVVNVSVAGATVPSVRSLDDNPIVTLAVGRSEERSVEEEGRSRWAADHSAVGVTEIPATSLSVFVTDTSLALRLL